MPGEFVVAVFHQMEGLCIGRFIQVAATRTTAESGQPTCSL